MWITSNESEQEEIITMKATFKRFAERATRRSAGARRGSNSGNGLFPSRSCVTISACLLSHKGGYMNFYNKPMGRPGAALKTWPEGF